MLTVLCPPTMFATAREKNSIDPRKPVAVEEEERKKKEKEKDGTLSRGGEGNKKRPEENGKVPRAPCFLNPSKRFVQY